MNNKIIIKNKNTRKEIKITPKLPKTIQEEIIKVLDYLYKDEKKHYEETYLDENGNIIDPEDKSRLNHIFISLDKIAKYFNY